MPANMLINIACNGIVLETTHIVITSNSLLTLPDILAPPCKGSRVLLKIGETWIMAHYKQTLYNAHQTPALMKYMKDK
jgi:hypothetical protein